MAHSKLSQGVGLAGQPDFKGLVVVIAAQIASSHGITSDYIRQEINAPGFTSLRLKFLPTAPSEDIALSEVSEFKTGASMSS